MGEFEIVFALILVSPLVNDHHWLDRVTLKYPNRSLAVCKLQTMVHLQQNRSVPLCAFHIGIFIIQNTNQYFVCATEYIFWDCSVQIHLSLAIVCLLIQKKGLCLFVVIINIQSYVCMFFAGHELLVWYGDDFASEVGIDKEHYSATTASVSGKII